MCPPGPMQPWQQTYAVGEALEADAIATVACAPHGTGRLRLNVATTGAGTVLDHQGCDGGLAWSYADTGSTKTCRPLRTPDGTIRCLPSEPLRTFYFADAACAQPLVTCDKGCDEGILVPGPGDDVVAGAAALRAVGPRFTGAQVFVALYAGGPCQPLPASGTPALWELGPAASWDRYPVLTEWRGTERLGH
jgi:hypothetical protein